MTEKTEIFGHEAVMKVEPKGYDVSIAYECQLCGMMSNKVSEFDRYDCQANRTK